MFEGLLAYVPTPTDADGRLDEAALVRIVGRLDAARPDAIGLLGSTGGYAYLDRDTRRRAVEVAAAHRPKGTPLVVGAGALRTDAAEALARDAAGAGADGLLLAAMCYTPLTDDEVFAHFQAVAGAAELPLCIYDNPGTTHFAVSDALLFRLAGLPTVRAVKRPLPAGGDVGGELARLRPGLPQGFRIGYSQDWGAARALLAGADGFHSVAAGLLPAPMLDLASTARDGDADAALSHDAALAPVWELFREFGSFRVVFAMAGMLGLADAVPPRPILPMPEAAVPRLRVALDRLGA